MTNTKTLLPAVIAAVVLLAPVAAFATPVALGGAGTRGAHELSRSSNHMMRRHSMMKRHTMMHSHREM